MPLSEVVGPGLSSISPLIASLVRVKLASEFGYRGMRVERYLLPRGWK